MTSTAFIWWALWRRQCKWKLTHNGFDTINLTVKNIRMSTDILRRVFHILTEPVSYTFESVNRRNNQVRAHIAMWACTSLFRRSIYRYKYTQPALLKYGKLATEYPWTYGYFSQCGLYSNWQHRNGGVQSDAYDCLVAVLKLLTLQLQQYINFEQYCLDLEDSHIKIWLTQSDWRTLNQLRRTNWRWRERLCLKEACLKT